MYIPDLGLNICMMDFFLVCFFGELLVKGGELARESALAGLRGEVGDRDGGVLIRNAAIPSSYETS